MMKTTTCLAVLLGTATVSAAFTVPYSAPPIPSTAAALSLHAATKVPDGIRPNSSTPAAKRKRIILEAVNMQEDETKTALLERDSTATAPLQSKTDKNDSCTQQQDKVEEKKDEDDESKKLINQIKDAGMAGVISYAMWELGFWTISIPFCLFAYYEATGHWPDLSDKEDITKLSAEAFAFVNFARFAVPLRLGLALSTTPWIQENIVDKFMKEDGSKN